MTGLERKGKGAMGIEAVTARKTTAARSAGRSSGLRSFDPARVAGLEYQAWVGYYQHNWHQALMAFVGLIRMGFGMNWYRTRTPPGWRCAPSSYGRPSQTTTPTAHGPAWRGFTPWSISAMASRPAL